MTLLIGSFRFQVYISMTPDLEQDKDAHAPHSPHSYSLNTVPGVPSRAIRQEKKVKGIQIGKEEEQVSLFADNIILYIENPKDSTKNILETINKYS